jgi:hypothetical protein
MPSDKDEEAIPEGLLKGISRPSLVHNDLTREYLDAGVELITDALDHDPAEGTHPFLGWLSQRTLVDAVTARGYLRGALGSLRDHWEPYSNYVTDLLVWSRYVRTRRSRFPVREVRRIRAAFESNATISHLIRGLSREVQRGILTDELFRLQLVLLSVAGSPKYRESGALGDTAEIYAEIDRRWLPLVHRFLTSRRLSLRPGVDEVDLVEIVTAVGEGLALRELADPTSGARRERRLRHQGTVILALLFACIDPGDSAPLDEALDRAQPRDEPRI